MHVRNKQIFWKSALKLTTAYLIVSGLYISFSGQIAAWVARDMEHLQHIEAFKGYAFIIVTALLLFFYARYMLKRDNLRQQELHAHRIALLRAEQLNVSSQMAWTIGHDINNILTIISFNIEVLDQRLNGGADTKKLIDTVGNATLRLRGLAQKLRDAGKVVANQQRTEFQLLPVIADAVELSKMVRSNMISTITVECSPEMKMFACAPIIQQALFNLFINAMDAADLGECIIAVQVELADGVVSITVDDNGPGVPKELESKIFDTFYTTKEQGSGLGLLSAQLCAQIHHGKLTFGKTRLGGACFRLELPVEAVGSDPLDFNYAI